MHVSVVLTVSFLFSFSILGTVAASTDDSGALDLEVRNKGGQPVASAVVGELVTIRSNITNVTEADKSLVHVVQVKDSDDRVIFISSMTIEVPRKTTEAMESLWRAEEVGLYTFQALVWPNLMSPPTFSYSTAQVQVNNEFPPVPECSGSASCFTGVVTAVIDGDTIDVGDKRIRFTLVDTPERGEGGYDEARSFTSAICAPGTKVLVDEDDGQLSGSYGRMIAKVYCDGQLINEELLESDNATILTQYCRESEFASEEWASRNGC